MSVRVRAPAKINLQLHVGPMRDDGYHTLSTVYCAVSLYDELTAHVADSSTAGLALSISGEGASELRVDDSNLVIRAARLVAECTRVPARARLVLHKNIPVAAGLAGGSADAAAALVACNELWGAELTASKLMTLAAELGSDVPFALLGGVALGEGRGEQVRTLNVLAKNTVGEPNASEDQYWVLAVADFGLSTRAVFVELDRMRATGEAPEPIEWANSAPFSRPGGADYTYASTVPAVERAHSTQLSTESVLTNPMHNDLEPAAFSLAPVLRDTVAVARTMGVRDHTVSGSGPTLVFSVDNRATGERVATALTNANVCRCAHIVTIAPAGPLSANVK